MSDKIKFKCACGKVVAADAKFAGKKAKCGGCGTVTGLPSILSAKIATQTWIC